MKKPLPGEAATFCREKRREVEKIFKQRTVAILSVNSIPFDFEFLMTQIKTFFDNFMNR